MNKIKLILKIIEQILLVIIIIIILVNLYDYFFVPHDENSLACYRTVDRIGSRVNKFININHEKIDANAEQIWKKIGFVDEGLYTYKNCGNKPYHISSDGVTYITIYCQYHGRYKFEVNK